MRGRFHHLPSPRPCCARRGADDEEPGRRARTRTASQAPLGLRLGRRRRRPRRGTTPPAAGRRRRGRPARARPPPRGVGTAAATRHGLAARHGEGDHGERRRDADDPAQRMRPSGPGARRGGSRPWSRPRAPATRPASGLRSRRPLRRRAPGPRPSTPGARGCRPGSVERCRGSASGSPAAGAARPKSSASVRWRSESCLVHVLCLRPGSRPAARGSSARREKDAT